MSEYIIDKVKIKKSEIKKNLEIKNEQAFDLERTKKNLMEAGFGILDSHVDKNVQDAVMQQVNNGLREVKKQANDLRNEMIGDFNSLQEIKEKTREALEDNKNETAKLKIKKELLDKVKLGGVLEDAISKMEDNYKDLEDVSNDIVQTEQEMQKIFYTLRNV